MSKHDPAEGPVIRRPIEADQSPADVLLNVAEDAGIPRGDHEKSLQDFVDLDALDALFGEKLLASGAVAMNFEAWGHRVTVRADEVVLYDRRLPDGTE